MATKKDEPPPAGQDEARDPDVVLVHGRTSDGQGLRALRARSRRLELAEIRPAKAGQPLHRDGELVQLKPREESPLLYDVEVHYRAGEQQEDGHGGPPRVTSQQYRDNWETIFGKRRKKDPPN